MSKKTILLWLRQDLRLADHPALAAALAVGAPVVPVYILDDAAAGKWKPGGASRWWLHHSLGDLARALEARGARLVLRRGDSADVLAGIAAETGAAAVHCTRCYEPWAVALEDDVRTRLAQQGVEVKRFGGSLLREPEQVCTKDGGPFKVYTPFWRALTSEWKPAVPLPAPERIPAPRKLPSSETLALFDLTPTKPDWAAGFAEHWAPGEGGALARLDTFLLGALAGYCDDRNRPDLEGTSRLSPHLHFGEISPRMCWHRARAAAAGVRGCERGLETFLKEIAWREFSYHLLVHFPHLPEAPFRPEFSHFPWASDAPLLKSWQRGRTGYPIVDAGLRELWATGWMHNRVRMIVASFLVKDLRIPWQDGAAWFWDTLVDADLASNSASWQWVAGSGADAAPYFRIFNPVTQGQKFDPNGDYIRRWVGEIARLPNSCIHAPWEAPALVLAQAGVELGSSYPLPMVDHALARQQALAAYERVKEAAKAA